MSIFSLRMKKVSLIPETFFIFFKCIQYKLFSSPIRYQIIESIPCLFRRIICQLKPPGDTVLGLHTEPLPAGIQI